MKEGFGMRGLSLIAGAALLAGCGGTAGTGGGGTPSSEYLFGTETTMPANGGSFAASGAETLEGLVGETLNVKFVRAQRRYPGDTIRLIVSDEEVTMTRIGVRQSGTRTVGESPEGTFTLGGRTYTFVEANEIEADSVETTPDGQILTLYKANEAMASGIYGVFTYAGSTPVDGEIDMEGFYLIGWETSPADVMARSGFATYEGEYDGYGQLLAGGTIIKPETEIDGLVSLTANFEENRIGGTLDGLIDPSSSVYSGRDIVYLLDIETVDIIGNSFASVLTAADGCSGCGGGGEIGGVFFGNGATEVSGLAAIDATFDDGTTRFIGAGGFSASEQP